MEPGSAPTCPDLTSEVLDEHRRGAVELQHEYSGVDIGAVLDLMVVGSEFFEPAPLERRVCSDPDVVVSGDRHVLHVSGYRGITVMKPRQFAEQYLRR